MHLADLHLGKSVLEQSMVEEQWYILKQIVNIVEEKKIDIVLIAGDVYDKTIPNIEAVHLFSWFLTRLHQLNVKVLVISGNHDSKDRLIFGNELFIDNGIYIEGIFNGHLRKVTFQDEYGNFNIYMLPFVKPADVRPYYLDSNIENYHDAIACIMKDIELNKDERNIIMVHQFVTAGGVELERSDSEVISLGGIDNVDVSLFDDFDYVAMGHIHGPQKLIRDTVRYAGSPLKYSFSEVYQKKSVPIIEFQNKGVVKLELVGLQPMRDMRVITGKFSQLMSKDVYQLGNVEDYISVVLTDEDYIMDAIGKLRVVYKNILKLEYRNSRSVVHHDLDYSGDENRILKSEFDLFCEFYKKQNNIELDEERQKKLQDIIHFIQEEK